MNGPDAAVTDFDGWIRELAANPRFGVKDRLGRAHLIDRASRLRGCRSVVSGDVISLARRLDPPDLPPRGAELPNLGIELTLADRPRWRSAFDHQVLAAHGHHFTHLDGYTKVMATVNSGSNTSLVLYAGLWANGDTWAQVDDVSVVP